MRIFVNRIREKMGWLMGVGSRVHLKAAWAWALGEVGFCRIELVII
jgi:hypothetical protein